MPRKAALLIPNDVERHRLIPVPSTYVSLPMLAYDASAGRVATRAYGGFPWDLGGFSRVILYIHTVYGRGDQQPTVAPLLSGAATS